MPRSDSRAHRNRISENEVKQKMKHNMDAGAISNQGPKLQAASILGSYLLFHR